MTESAPLPELWDFLQRMKVAPFGIPIMQRSWQVLTIFSLIDSLHIETFIELGVWVGGLADLLIRRAEMVGDIVYYGFDTCGVTCGQFQTDDSLGFTPERAAITQSRLDGHPSLVLADVLEPATVVVVSSIIRARAKAALVYCDDGDKPREMRTYAPILRVGDYMMSHDVPSGNSVADLAAFGVEFPYMVEIDPPLYRGLELSLWRRNA